MKYRDSGMPNEEMWSNFFNPSEILSKMEVDNSIHALLDIGCGYVTFLIVTVFAIRGSDGLV